MFTPTRTTLLRLSLGALVSLSALAGCSDDPAPVTDAGVADTGTTDTGAADAGTTDSGAVDSGSLDAGFDGGTVDSGTPDVVTPTDGGADVVTPTDGTSSDVPMANADAGMLPTMPTLVPVSANGHDRFFGVAYAPNGSFYATGVVAQTTESSADFSTVVAHFNANGTLDTTFGTNGFATVNLAVGTNGEVTRGIVVQPSGKIVVAGTVEAVGGAAADRNIALARFNANGTLDSTFGTAGIVTLDLSTGVMGASAFVTDTVWGLNQYSDGRLVLSGSMRRTDGMDSDFMVARLTVDGARDTTFGTNGVFSLDIDNRDASPRTTNILADGSIVMAGYYTESSVVRPVLFKLTPAGARDTTFGTNGVYTEVVLGLVTEAYAAATQGTSFITSGYGRASTTENIDWLSLRISATGTRDLTYGTSGVARLDFNMFNDNARSLVVLPDNRVLMVGGGRTTETNSDALLGMLTANGQRDATFGTNGFRSFNLGGGSDFFWAAALSPNGNHVAVVGTKAVVTGETGNDDAAVFVLSTR